MEKEDSSTLMVMSMMANGSMIKLMGLEFIAILMEQNMKVTGKRTNNTETVLKLGLMVQNMKDNMSKVKNMDSQG